MGRKRSGGDTAPLEDPMAAPMDNIGGGGLPPRMSVLQAMCAAALPGATMGGRQNDKPPRDSQETWGGRESQFQEGLMGSRKDGDFHANSLLKTGHFVVVNNELAKMRRHKEAINQLTGNKTKEGAGTPNAVVQKHLGGLENRPFKPPAEPSSKKRRTEPVSPRDHDGSSKGEPSESERPRQGMKEAIALAKAPNDLRRAKESFMKKFLAKGTLLAKNAKRRKILELLKAIAGDDHFPANQELILAVATALDEAKLQSGDQYIHEMKLMHIEAGHEWSSPLERQLFLCKKALKRHRGPEVRAKEFQIRDIKQEIWETVCKSKGGYVRPAWLYAVAVLWMLRACEATELQMGDLSIDCDAKTVALTVRKSKTDQAARGAKRTLSCCGRQTCTRECPFALAIRVLADRPNGREKDPLFATRGKPKRNRTHTARCWAKELDKDLTGHSARRSGAMFYTRQGMDIQDISFLGRWRSSAVFRYMEEAMQERPMNNRLKSMAEDEAKFAVVNHAQSLERWTASLTEGKTEVPATPAPATPGVNVAAPSTPAPIRIPDDPEDLQLWATSWTRSKRKVTHLVTKASWQTDLNEWSTACWRHFAQRSVKVSLSKLPPNNAHKCLKCDKVRELRDIVPGGAGLAQLVSNELDAMLPQNAKPLAKGTSAVGSIDPPCNAQKAC